VSTKLPIPANQWQAPHEARLEAGSRLSGNGITYGYLPHKFWGREKGRNGKFAHELTHGLGRIRGERCRYPAPSLVSAAPSGQPSATRSALSARSGDYRPHSPQAWPTALNDFAT